MTAIDFHDDIAHEWNDKYAAGRLKKRLDFIKSAVLDKIAINSSDRWLDAGCGSGIFSRMLAQKAGHVTGVDGSENMVSVSRTLADQQRLSERTVFERIETVEDLAFETSSFDGVISLSVLEYVPDPLKALSEYSRVVKDGGLVVVSIPHSSSLYRRVQSSKILGRHSKGQYLQYSKFSLNPKTADAVFNRLDFDVISQTHFDPIIPLALLPVIPGSLVYYTLRKTG